MNDQAQARPADAAVRTISVGVSAKPMRSPAELAQQLDRNIKSLELTGSHLEPAKDQPFYAAVAADMREAAAFLKSWDDLVAKLTAEADVRENQGRMFGFSRSWEIADKIAGLMEDVPGGPSFTWRSAALAIAEAIRSARHTKAARS